MRALVAFFNWTRLPPGIQSFSPLLGQVLQVVYRLLSESCVNKILYERALCLYVTFPDTLDKTGLSWHKFRCTLSFTASWHAYQLRTKSYLHHRWCVCRRRSRRFWATTSRLDDVDRSQKFTHLPRRFFKIFRWLEPFWHYISVPSVEPAVASRHETGQTGLPLDAYSTIIAYIDGRTHDAFPWKFLSIRTHRILPGFKAIYSTTLPRIVSAT